jgi:transcriptional regulator with XRE-family HTH domain
VESIGEKIKALRGNKTRQEWLEEHDLRIEAQHLYKIETGIRSPSKRFLQRLSTNIGIPMSFLLDEDIKELKCLPIELSDLGMEYIFVAKEAQQNGLSPEELHKLIELASFMKKHD